MNSRSLEVKAGIIYAIRNSGGVFVNLEDGSQDVIYLTDAMKRFLINNIHMFLTFLDQHPGQVEEIQQEIPKEEVVTTDMLLERANLPFLSEPNEMLKGIRPIDLYMVALMDPAAASIVATMTNAQLYDVLQPHSTVDRMN